MARVYDNWERLVEATLRREQLKISGQRTPSELSLASLSASSSFNFSSSFSRVSTFNFPDLLVGDSFTYHQILLATNYLSKSNLIKRGHSVDFFYGVFEYGIRVAVKKIDISSVKKESDLVSELEIFGKVSHSRLVPLLGHCLENMNEKFLVYKYMPHKDLSSSLFNKDAPKDEYESLDWITRLKIATGAAEGLCYLHNECVPPLVHRDIQASSILLDDYFEVRLGSLVEVCTAEEKNSIQNIFSRFLRLPKGPGLGTSGKSNATFADDVYCFGKVLLELVTGKLGFSAAKDSSMEDWMDKTLTYITLDDRKPIENIVDPSLIVDEDFLTEVWAVAIVARSCLNPRPLNRPEMVQILEALENPSLVVNEENADSANFTTSDAPKPPGWPGSGGLTPREYIHAGKNIGVQSNRIKSRRQVHLSLTKSSESST